MGAAATAMLDLSHDLSNRTLQDELTEFILENQDMGHRKSTPHLLFLGKGGSGKTALGNVLTTGRSRGTPGPVIGTSEYISSEAVTHGNMSYIKHDTRGIGDSDADIEQVKRAIQYVYQKHKEECIVIICIRFNDRIRDTGNKQCFEVCQSLDTEVWSNTIIAITHSEIPHECNNYRELEELKIMWRNEVKDTMSGLGVNTDEVPICFTSHTEAERPIEDTWIKQLLKTIFDKASLSESHFRLMFTSLISTLEAIIQTGSTSELEDTHESICASIMNCPIVSHSLGQDKILTGGATVGATIGAVVGGGVGVAAAVGTGLAATAGTVAGLAAFGAITIATGGGGALIGVGLGAGIAIATLLVWLWMRRRKERIN